MRPKVNPQAELDFQPSNLKLTNRYYQRLEALSLSAERVGPPYGGGSLGCAMPPT